MSDLEEKLGAVLSNPQLMQQIQSMAQSLGSQQETPKESPSPVDPRILQSMMGMVQQGQVDSDQQALLNALCPYLSRQRIDKLEKAMRAARLANAASSFLSAGGLNLLSGR